MPAWTYSSSHCRMSSSVTSVRYGQPFARSTRGNASKHPKSSASRMKRGKASWARGEQRASDGLER